VELGGRKGGCRRERERGEEGVTAPVVQATAAAHRTATAAAGEEATGGAGRRQL
jgi:hypothetical protein